MTTPSVEMKKVNTLQNHARDFFTSHTEVFVFLAATLMASVKRNVKKPKDFYQHFLPMKYLDFPATDFKLFQQIF